jgi:ABC-type antimicrobial peptide transport system permease subunit
MRTIAVIQLSLNNLRANKRRSLLTMLGLMIGILSVILVMSAGAGAQSLITNQVKARGTDQIVILAGASDPNGPPASAVGIITKTLTEGDKDALLRSGNTSNLQYAAGYITGNDTLSWESEERGVNYTGTNAEYEKMENVTVANGEFFDETDEAEVRRVLVLGSEIATEIFGNQDPVGQAVKLAKKQFTVVGVLKEHGATMFEDVNSAVLMPLSTAQQDLLGVNHVSFIRVKVNGEENLDQAMEEIRETLIDRHGEEDFSIRNTADLLAILTTITNALKFFLVAIAGISLFVGGVGIMNIMLISVKEKTREIGLRKAVGARDTDIMRQFLFETITLSLVGGLVGMVLGIILSFIIAQVVQGMGYDYSFIISPASIIVSILIATGIGLVFGLTPARRAAALGPTEALRYE